MPRRLVSGSLVLALSSVLALGQSPAAGKTEPFPRFTLKEGKLDADGLPQSGASLCLLGKTGICYQMPSETYPESPNVTYEFGLEPQSERLPLAKGGSWVFFSAIFSGGGSGTLTRLAVLRYVSNGPNGRIENLMPWVGATNVSESAMWTLPDLSNYPVLVRADFIWGDGEVHFASHFYKVEAWKFDPGPDRYAKAFTYTTSRKYNGGDHSPIRVLGPERAEIIRRLASH
jgi:hypothetical protein